MAEALRNEVKKMKGKSEAESDRNEHEERKSMYLRVWELAFGEFLDWSAEKVIRWSKRYPEMNEPNPMFYNNSELWFVARFLVPNCVRRRGSLAHIKFEGEIEYTILNGHDLRDLLDRFDWKAARIRLEVLLSKVGCTLTELRVEVEERF